MYVNGRNNKIVYNVVQFTTNYDLDNKYVIKSTHLTMSAKSAGLL